MKSLDEVIDLFDNGCIRPCVECPCYGMKECQEQLAAESYYLHKYQKIEDEYDELKDWWAEEHAENLPLSWEELRQMEGKPVWIDSVPLVRRWVIIKKFHPIGGNKNLFDMEVEDGAHFLKKNMRRDDPAWWQAYRKERTDVQS